jgi:hypothetical protein
MRPAFRLPAIIGKSLALVLALASGQTMALGECGLSCCLAGANSSGVTLAENFGLAVQYEYSDMTTIRHGTDSISPNKVIDKHWKMGGRYAVPTNMTMEKLSLIGAVPINERWQLVGIVPYIRNNMDMRMRMPMGMQMDREMETISSLGDISALALYTAYTDAPVRPSKRLTVGFGVKAPTGSNDERTPSGTLVHAMMQPGSGSWDALFTVNYMRAWYPLVTQVGGFYHLTTEGDGGYEFGDQFGLDLLARYQVSSYINLGVELNIIHAAKDTDHDGRFSRPMMSMVDNVDNTGLTSVMLAPGIQFKIPDTRGSLELKYQKPIYQDVNGYQQVLDSRWLATTAWAW